MDAILRQIGELLISSIPTIIALLIVWVGYRFIVHGKLQQVLEQRHALTEGAMERLWRHGVHERRCIVPERVDGTRQRPPTRPLQT